MHNITTAGIKFLILNKMKNKTKYHTLERGKIDIQSTKFSETYVIKMLVLFLIDNIFVLQ